MNFGRETHKFLALQASTQEISDQKHEEETEDRILCSLDQHQVPRKSQISSLSCCFIIFTTFHHEINS